VTVRAALVTCGPQVEVALQSPDLRVPSLVRLASARPNTSLLLAALDLLFEDAGVEQGSLELVLVSRGPGSFTGIRAGLASAAGLAAGTGAQVRAYGSLTMQAARVAGSNEVWAAQPGRRGEIYARPFRISSELVPTAVGDLRILPVDRLGQLGPWAAADAMELSEVARAPVCRSAAEALLHLDRAGLASEEVAPLYVEGPPVHGQAR
jgi:tRNA threonylcarbamoyladenosine biosynthesis protein TsaB